MTRSPFRPIDLFVCVAVAIALLTGAAGARRSAQEVDVLFGCAEKLRQIAQSLVLYQGISDGHFPRTRYDPARPLTAYTAPDAADPFAANGPAVNDTTASLFLLARVMELPPDAFICPSALRQGLAQRDDFDRGSVKRRSNFRARVYNNYSLANMFPDAVAVAAGYSLDRFHDRLPADFAIAADTNPGGAGLSTATTQLSRQALRMTNSPNHERDGQNVLFADGSVRFSNHPFAGIAQDNVYAGRPDGSFQPKGAADSVLVPVWSAGPQTIARTTANRRWVLAASAVGVFVVIGWVVWHGMRKRTDGRSRPDG